MRVLMTSSGCATVMEATAPATEAMESCMKVASEYFSSCALIRFVGKQVGGGWGVMILVNMGR